MKRENGIITGSRRYCTRLKAKHGWPELTALVDIFFLALLFFVLSSSFVRVSGISVDLPRLKVSNMAALERYVVTITPPDKQNITGQIYFRDRLVDYDGLRQEFSSLHDRSKRVSVIIRADKSVPFSQVAAVMAIAEDSRISCFIAVAPPTVKNVAGFEVER